MIVGHGPSLLLRSCGYVIDQHRVVRLKRCHETFKKPWAYGIKTHAVCGSWTIRNGILDIPGEHWAFIDSRHDPSAAEIKAYPGYVNRPVCDEWNEKYRTLRTPYQPWPNTVECQTSTSGLGHNHLSAGFHAILYVCEKWKPQTIRLAGFDNLWGERTWSVTRGEDYTKYPDHRWDIENQMIPLVEESYGVKICAL